MGYVEKKSYIGRCAGYPYVVAGSDFDRGIDSLLGSFAVVHYRRNFAPIAYRYRGTLPVESGIGYHVERTSCVGARVLLVLGRVEG